MKAHHDTGFAYVEVLAAAVLLALCVVPATSAVKNALAAPPLALSKLREMRCLQATMETVLAEPYTRLWQAAGDMQTASSYSQPADANCVQRNVYIAQYSAPYGGTAQFLPYPTTPQAIQAQEDALLYVTVSSPDSAYSFTTLVVR